MALRVEVQRRGEIAVKQAIRNEGRRKVSQVKRSEMAALGREYLAAHPELIPEAKPIIEQSMAEGVLWKAGSARA